MASRKQGLQRKGGGGETRGEGDGAADALQRRRIVLLDQARCKPNSEAFQYLSRYARACGRECITLQKPQRVPKEARAQQEVEGAPPVPAAGRIVISEDACAACLMRAKKCPGDAVTIVNLPSNLETDCTHRYGENAFKLHGLPTPRAGCVLGLLGTNGIGKSTALKVLAGKLKPNLGRLNDPPSWQEILNYYRGSAVQAYLSRLLEEDIRVVTKVQLDTDYVRKLRGRVVGDVLRQRDQRGAMEELVARLELGAVLDREVQELSGGELQRFAICVVCCQDADVYMFDEASSFLDIKQRMTATEVIRDLANLRTTSDKARYVVVVEHDLAVLDYMSDQICCLYGEPGAYGVVTKVASVTNGINNYLAGYFPAENMRFRAEAISFSVSSASSQGDALLGPGGAGEVMGRVDYPAMSRTLKGESSSFTLHVNAGHFEGAECVGLLGQNGCGKTTFMDMLAGHFDKPEGDESGGGAKGEADACSLAGLGVSYKRQVYAPRLRKFKGTVQDIIEKEIQGVCADALFNVLVLKPLKVGDLYDKRVQTLSGGELQRLAIVLCLGRRASVYLLDEPSAGLDCEQRIVAAKVIRRWVVDHQRKTAFVIEHDFVMAAALADKVVVYEGTPGKECTALSPVGLVQGFNSFLKQLDVTFRRDPSNHRPRVNKRGSLKDTEQKATGQLFTFDVDPEDEKEAAAANNKENRRGADGKNGKGGRAGK